MIFREYSVNRELKHLFMGYSDGEKDFLIQTLERKADGTKVVTGEIILNKTYAFSLMRFILRIAQRNWLRRKK